MTNSKKIIYGKKSYRKDGIIFIKKEDLEIPHGDDYKIAIKELRRITELRDLEFLRQFEFEDNSFWWFIFPSIIPVYKKIVNFIILFQKLIDSEKPIQIEIEEDFEKFLLIKQLCHKNKIKFSYSKLNYSKFLLSKKLISNLQKLRFARITKKKIKARKKLFDKIKLDNISLKNKIIFAVPTAYRRKIFDYKTCNSRSGEYIQEPIMDLLKNEEILGIDLDYTFRGDLERSSERLNDKIPWIPIELFLGGRSKSDDAFLTKYQKILRKKQFQEIFVFRDIHLWSNLEETFQKMSYSPNLPLFLNLTNSLEEYFKVEPPKAVFLPYETGPYALSFIIACENLGIKTIGVSHAFIAENFPMYSHFSCKSKNYLLGHPIPDVTLVFGEFAKRVLVNASYPSEKVIVFGNPVFFNIDKLLKSLSKTTILEKYKINKDVNLVLFTTGKLQPKYTEHGNYDYDIQVWKQLVEKFGNDERFYFILKPHPQETNVEVYEEILKQTNVNNFQIINGDLFELIFISDLVVSIYSTTMIDSLCFQKPVIQVKFRNETHPIPFEKYNALLTSEITDLSSTIRNCISNRNIQKELTVNREKFLKEQYGIPEGNTRLVLDKLLND